MTERSKVESRTPDPSELVRIYVKIAQQSQRLVSEFVDQEDFEITDQIYSAFLGKIGESLTQHRKTRESDIERYSPYKKGVSS